MKMNSLFQELDLRTLQCGHTMIRADPFATSGWCPPPEIPRRLEKLDDRRPYLSKFVPARVHVTVAIQSRESLL